MGAARTAWLLLAAWLTAHVTVAVAEPESWDPWGMFSRDPSERPREERGAALRRVRGPAPVNTFESEAASISELVAVRVAEDLEDGGQRRSLLHGCHGRRNTRCSLPPRCSNCAFPQGSPFGHCRRRSRLFRCNRRGIVRPPRALVLESRTCPNLFMLSEFNGPTNPGEYGEAEGGLYGAVDEEDYTEVPIDGDFEIVPDPIGDVPAFAAVTTAEELQKALRAGTNHILITAHLDATEVTPERDLKMREALNNAVGRVQNTTLSIAGWCDELPPDSFNLTEPVPPGACAILVREDFLDTPLGTNCLLLDSLYVAVDTTIRRRRQPGSSVLVLHVDGLMWITNCVFQGGTGNGRAIDTNTINGGVPELYIKDTTFTTFRRTLGPGIRALPGSRVWLDGVTFRDIAQPRLPSSRRLNPARVPVASAVAASEDVFLVIVNVTIEGNEVLGEPAGVRAIGIDPNGTAVFALPRIEVWQWPQGTAALSRPEIDQASFLVSKVARPQVEMILEVQREIVQDGLMRIAQDAEP